MKHLRRKCAGFCGGTYDVWREGDEYYDPRRGKGKVSVSWRSDPYAEEIHGDTTKMWLCDDCEYEYAMDI